MKRLFVTLLLLVGVVSLGVAASDVVDRGTFYYTGAGTANLSDLGTELVAPQGGQIHCDELVVATDAGEVYSVKRASVKTSIEYTSSSVVYVHTDSSNNVDGLTVAVGDYLIFGGTAANLSGDLRGRAITATGTYSATTKTTAYTVAGVAPSGISTNDICWIADAGDNITIDMTDASVTGVTAVVRDAFTGFKGMPVCIQHDSGDAQDIISGLYTIRK